MTIGKFQELANRLMKLDILERSEMKNVPYSDGTPSGELSDMNEEITLTEVKGLLFRDQNLILDGYSFVECRF